MKSNFKNPHFLRHWRRQKIFFRPTILAKEKLIGKNLKINFSGFVFWLKLIWNLISKYRARFILLLLFFGVFIFLAKNLVPKLPVFSNTLVIGVVGEYTIDNLPQSLTQLYSSGLTRFDGEGKVVGGLAKIWETQDGKKFKFILQDNLFWQDGKKLKAQDLKFQNLNATFKILDEKTIEFTLTDTYSPYSATLTKPVFRQNTKIGTGPYKLSKILKTGQILRQVSLTPLTKDLPKVIVRFYPNSQTATTAFKTGKVGMIFNLMRLNGLESWKNAQIEKTLDSARLVAVFYNTKDELLQNLKVRKALDLSIDRSKFSNQVTTPYPPNSWVFVKTTPIFDLTKAKKIISDEKITGGKLKILTPQVFEKIAAEISKNWQTLGIDTEIEKIDKIPQNFQVAIFGLEIPADPDQYSFWHSTQSQTLTKIEDPKLDKLLEDGRKLINPEERKAKYQELQKELRELVPASFLFFPDRYIVINKNSSQKIDQIKKLLPQFPIN